MKKLDLNQDKESLLEEVKRLRKENKKLASQKDKLKAKYDKTQKELKKKDVRKITLTDEQSRLLSSLFPDEALRSLHMDLPCTACHPVQ